MWAVQVLIIDEFEGLVLVADRWQSHRCLLVGCTGIALCPNSTYSLAGGSEDVVHIPHWSSTLWVSPSLSYATSNPQLVSRTFDDVKSCLHPSLEGRGQATSRWAIGDVASSGDAVTSPQQDPNAVYCGW